MKYLAVLFFTLALLLTCKQHNINNYVRFQRPSRSLLLVPATLNGISTYFMLDSGAQSSILDSVQMYRYGIYTDTVIAGNFIGIGGKTPYYYPYNVQSLQLNNKDYTISFAATDLSGTVASVWQTDDIHIIGILGADFMGKYGVNLNFRNNMLTITKQ